MEEQKPGGFQNLYTMFLLFPEKGGRPEAETLRTALEERLGPTDLVADVSGQLTTLAVTRFPVTYQDNQQVPAQVLMADYAPFTELEKLDTLTRSQFWDCPESEELLSRCQYQLMVSDFMSGGLPYKDRCALLTEWLEIALEQFPDCLAVWLPHSWKLLTREQILHNPYETANKFLYIGLNTRFFKIEGTEDMVIDTMGMNAIGLPDLQYHFHGLDPNELVVHSRNVASYLYENDAPIKSGETIDGIVNGTIVQHLQWKCQYEMALVQPEREVMDICPGAYASGGR